ncbi:hypothetical protein QNI19_20520 [Cytophagaceae bacterium DM2B3-1]|uniref:Lipoprotein n=1 Tax=Xanthocytophaga flava TaxID=3048013 RepID=A0ABT7CP91_9BACT|nr:hypothetical protein [Xanthocytophaga flavus]MDJ1495336.1 hypothetical protein [Xanthocytophaga flavus]
MRSHIILSLLFLTYSCSPLEEQEQTIEMMWVGWACDCPNWIKPTDLALVDSSGYDCEKEGTCIDIVPASSDLKIPEEHWQQPDGWHHFRFTGRFYTTKRPSLGNDRIVWAKTFRYTKYEYILSPWQIANRTFLIKDSVAERIVENLPEIKDSLNQVDAYHEKLYQITLVEPATTSYPYYCIALETTTGDSIVRKYRVDACNGYVEPLTEY